MKILNFEISPSESEDLDIFDYLADLEDEEEEDETVLKRFTNIEIFEIQSICDMHFNYLAQFMRNT
jgi:hypothetical protein